MGTCWSGARAWGCLSPGRARAVPRASDGRTSVKTILNAVLAVACVASCGAAIASESDDLPAIPLVNAPVQIPYTSLHRVLAPGATGFLQYSFVGTTATPTTPLSSIVASWTSVPAMLSIDQTNVTYQPDPADPSSQLVLPKVWDFTGLQTGTLSYRTFNTTRDDTAWDTCLESCSLKNQTATPPDGSWQAYLKIDTFNLNGTALTRDLFVLNDSSTWAGPALDVRVCAC